MKKIFAVSLLVILLAVPGLAVASSYYVTLEGTVGSIQDGAGLASSANIGVGANVKYVLEIDTDRTGYTIKNGKIKNVNNSYFSTLYAGVLSGDAGSQNNYLKESNDWYSALATNDMSGINLTNWGSDLEDLTVGTKIGYMHEYSYSSSNNWKYTQLNLQDMTVTNISNVAPTPIPGAALIMLGGLGVVGFVRRKFS